MIPAVNHALVVEVQDTLRQIQRWRLVPSGWARVTDALDDLENALGAGDMDGVSQAVAALWSEQRARRVGDANPARTASSRELERIDMLVHQIGGLSAAPDDRSGDEDEDEGQDDGSATRLSERR